MSRASSSQVSKLALRGLFHAFLPCPWYPQGARWNEATVEFNKDILEVGQQWERADGATATVLSIGETCAYIGLGEAGIWYYYRDGGKSNIHHNHPHLELLRLLPNQEETTEVPLDEIEDDAAPVEQETEAQEQNVKVQEQNVTVVSHFSNSVHNYPQLGYAVVYINGLQIEVDFDERELTVQDNSNLHEPLSNL